MNEGSWKRTELVRTTLRESRSATDISEIDVRYANFRADINNFRYLLQKLEEALKAAQERYENRGPSFGEATYEPLSRELEAERKVIIGDFYATLRE